MPRWLRAAAVVFVLFIVGAMAFAIFEPIQVLPRLRIAPGYSLDAQDGSTWTSESARGSVVLYTFAPTDCEDACTDMDETMREVRERVAAEVDLGDTEFRLVTIALDPIDDVRDLATGATRSGADGQRWRWVGGTESEIRTVVGAGFRRYFETDPTGVIRFDPGFVLVDGLGVVRGEYRYHTLADDSDKLVNHIGILAEEIRYADGAAAVAYEAAHLFLCYP